MKNVDKYELNQDNHDLKYEAYARRENVCWSWKFDP